MLEGTTVICTVDAMLCVSRNVIVGACSPSSEKQQN